MIALAFLLFLVSVALLGLLLPRFAGMVASRLWERRLARRQKRIEQASGREPAATGPATSGDERPTGFVSGRRASLEVPARVATDESGAALPSTLGVLAVVAFGYIAFLAVRQILRVAGALP